MATKAYILIKVKAGKTKDVIKHLKKIPGVEQVHPCFGQPDIFSFVSVDALDRLWDISPPDCQESEFQGHGHLLCCRIAPRSR